jgi:hypothetical protein
MINNFQIIFQSCNPLGLLAFLTDCENMTSEFIVEINKQGKVRHFTVGMFTNVGCLNY